MANDTTDHPHVTEDMLQYGLARLEQLFREGRLLPPSIPLITTPSGWDDMLRSLREPEPGYPSAHDELISPAHPLPCGYP
jgi:hypothetical protein